MCIRARSTRHLPFFPGTGAVIIMPALSCNLFAGQVKGIQGITRAGVRPNGLLPLTPAANYWHTSTIYEWRRLTSADDSD
jgi:hypothetical protein